jgi:hypothetical protein
VLPFRKNLLVGVFKKPKKEAMLSLLSLNNAKLLLKRLRRKIKMLKTKDRKLLHLKIYL